MQVTECRMRTAEMQIIDVQYKRPKWNFADLFTEPVNAVTARRLIGRLNGYSDFTVAIENEGK